MNEGNTFCFGTTFHENLFQLGMKKLNLTYQAIALTIIGNLDGCRIPAKGFECDGG
ncbi:MAG: hypothetical protein IPH88_15710 [Bacteroidales bacterium]|nr:hypothetical protein [Bacteroidales bacterium]